MTFPAVIPKTALVNIVLAVALRALRWGRIRRTPVAVTSPAGKLQVSAFQREFGFVVVESPAAPRVGVVTCLTAGAISAVVRIYSLMTVFTCRARVRKSVVCMAAFAEHQAVHPEKRENGQVMMEKNSPGPVAFIVAIFTVGTAIVAVHVLFLMARYTTGWLFPGAAGVMAGTTFQLAMALAKFETCIPVMVEIDVTPVPLAMAALTLLPQCSSVHIAQAVATGAFIIQHNVDPGLVTQRTGDRLVLAAQSEFGYRQMVKPVDAPGFRCVAPAAVFAIVPGMNVVAYVAAVTPA